MDFGILNLMGSREADKPTAQVFGEVAEQTRLADEPPLETIYNNLSPLGRIAPNTGGMDELDT